MTPNELRGDGFRTGPQDPRSRDDGAAPETLEPDDELTSIVLGMQTPTRSMSIQERVFEIVEGTMLGDYRISGLIGQGGMGTVFAAVHPVIGKRAAIKILKKEQCADPQSVKRFLDEARVVNEIGHRNIVDIFAFGETPDGRSYLVMEFLRGQTLAARIASHRLMVPEVCAVLRSLAHALEAAHAKGVIHRDLKPDNVFLVEERDHTLVKLLDFGIAKLSRDDRKVERTATGAMIGTPQYIAPEQAKGKAIDPRADIYSLGCVTFELLTGRPPFVADNAMEMVAKHLMEAPQPPSQLTAVPLELDRLVLAMLAKDPAHRPSLFDVCAVLDQVGRPGTAPGARAVASDRESSIEVTRSRGARAPTLPIHRRDSRRALWIAAGVIATGTLGFAVARSRLGSEPVVSPRGEPMNVRAAQIAPPVSAPQPPSVARASATQPPAPPPDTPEPRPSQRPAAPAGSAAEPRAPQPAAPAPSAAEPRAPQLPRDRAAAPAAEPPSAPLPSARPRVREVRVRVAPAAAVIRLDSVVIGDGIVHFPLDGRPHRLSITAPSFEPRTVLLDGATPSSLHVELIPKPLSL